MDIAGATGVAPSANCWQGTNGQHNHLTISRPDTQVLVPGNNSQPSMGAMMPQVPSTQPMATSPEACEASPQPCTMAPSPAMSNQYVLASSPHQPCTTSHNATQQAINGLYASPHRGNAPHQMHSLLSNHHSQNGMYPNTPISELPNGHPNSPENCLQEITHRENGLINHSKPGMRLVNGKIPHRQHRGMMMSEKYPMPPSHCSQNGAHLESAPYIASMANNLLPENTYLTPSPESPGKWSSSSPISASDWSGSEGIRSPPVSVQMNGHELMNGHSHDLVNGHDLGMTISLNGTRTATYI